MNTPGCEHYKRKCKLVAPCCNKAFTCRLCHDEKQDHPINRKAVKQLICSVCGVRQTIKPNCTNCGVRFGKYACLECRLFDDEDKQQFHCEACGICRVGGTKNYFHCQKCNCCLALRLMDTHKCVENASRNDCSVCLEFLHSSTKSLHVSKCGHLLHEACYEELKGSGITTCPTCKTAAF